MDSKCGTEIANHADVAVGAACWSIQVQVTHYVDGWRCSEFAAGIYTDVRVSICQQARMACKNYGN